MFLVKKNQTLHHILDILDLPSKFLNILKYNNVKQDAKMMKNKMLKSFHSGARQFQD